MFVYTSCRDCGGQLTVTHHGQSIHPLCAPKPTRMERLCDEFVAAVERGDSKQADEIEQHIDELDSKPPRLLDAALAYAAWGWPVFPLLAHGETNPRTGEPSTGKQPATRNGFKNATTDTARIRDWWTRHPNHNIGLPTGGAFDVIDIDPPIGLRSYAQMIDMIDPKYGTGPLPDCHGRVTTPRGGLHLYTTPMGNNNHAGLLPGIDVRGNGGYVVAPPSVLPTGRWAWTVKPSPAITSATQAHMRAVA